ncbi:MAG: hypothetical protein KF845_08110 [Cyclobacteriaceae bacterium]|nr:hypothetical protein [Cyclobacteriaceae bacterium]
MMTHKTLEKSSDEQRIGHIRDLRNSLIKDFLIDDNLVAYFEKQYNHKQLNTRRLEFIKKELRELLIAPVDLVHYAPLLLEMKQEGTASITSNHEGLFYVELDRIFSKYTF